MKTITKSLLAIIGATDVVFYMATPILLAIIWASLSSDSWGNYIIYLVAIVSTIFRSIKIGWLKNE